ncbi:MAG: hypothetical protein ACLFV3_09165 [Phycisphaeraceae bacterium]
MPIPMFSKSKRQKPGSNGSAQITREKQALDLVNSLQDEAQEHRANTKQGMSLEQEWERNGHRMLGNHWTDVAEDAAGGSEGYRVLEHPGSSGGGLRGIHRSTLNVTGTAIISNTAKQTMQPTVVRFQPVETGGRATWFLSRDGGEILDELINEPLRVIEADRRRRLLQARVERDQALLAVEPDDVEAVEALTQAFEDQRDLIEQKAELARQNHLASIDLNLDPEQLVGEFGPSQPLSRRQAGKVRTYIDQGVLEERDLIRIDDTLKAKAAQRAFDQLFERAHGSAKLVMNEFRCNVFGQQYLRFQWHDRGERKHTFSLENTHMLNVWIDPTHDSLDESRYLIFEHPMSLDQALAELPTTISREEIEEAAEKGPVQKGRVRRAAVWQQTDWKQKVVLVRVGWIRHQQVPMTVEEALEEGLIDREPVMRPVLDDGGEPMIDPRTGEAIQEQATDEKTGALIWRYHLVDKLDEAGEHVEVTPQTKTHHGTDWPNTTGVRQIVTLPGVERVVQDIRCPYLDIPGSWNLNIPRPDGSPFGQGEPVRLESVSQQINRLLSVMDNYARYFQFPQVWMPQKIYNELKRAGYQLHSRPGAVVPVPDALYERIIAQGGFAAMVQQVPTMPAFLFNLFNRLLDMHSRISGHSDIDQGQAPYAGASGALVNTLAQQSAGPLALRSKFTEWAMERTGRIALDAMVKWMPETRWREILDEYDLPVIREIIAGIAAMRWDVSVETASGRGANRTIDEQRTMTMHGAGLLSRKTTMERVGVPDPEAEEKRIHEEQGLSAQASPAVQAAFVDQADPVAAPAGPGTPQQPVAAPESDPGGDPAAAAAAGG